MYTIKYLKDIPTIKKILAAALMVAGIVIFLDSIFVGIFAFVVGFNFMVTEGSEIDLENKIYRNIKSIFGISFGKWKPCPDFEYVAVFKTKENTRVSAYGAQMATIQTDIILLNVFYTGNKYITFYKTNDRNDAFKVAEHLKSALDIDILDATGKEKVWI